MQTVGQRLRFMRKKKKMTLMDMAEAIGSAKSTYAAYESGFRSPQLDTISQISQILGTSSDYLLGITDDPYQSTISSNAKDFLKSENLHWDGVPLDAEDLKLVVSLLERVLRDKAPTEDQSGK
ncbi:helix-turn-helix domain-containing protein [Paenibacillus eucommiae]|uniref:Transcriptional regulator with XRE-family HTH domain n=1 Tax=Paenibacillus eucommiae TaxID=1355755 RepID=A0ABS4ITD5_9BACL|nr:helix-turn-helix transcriptional regulator [Paenibacillus eucommiae]MBP1990286.1 transcriptional regulator with XRE-family HTH domain [Paenibacillus eucommiae]